MTLDEVMAELERLGSEQTRKTWTNHGATPPMFGVKVGDLKVILKKIKNDTALARQLWATDNCDAMYLAGLVTHGGKLGADELDTWVRQARWQMLSEYTVPWLASEHPQGWALGLRWIDDPSEQVSSAGWATLAAWISVTPDERLDLDALRGLLERVAATLGGAPNRTRYAMNGFVISVGGYVPALTELALSTAARVGKVHVDMGGTACKVPSVAESIGKMRTRGNLGVKRATAKC